MTILGYSKAALAFICDALSSDGKGTNEVVYIFNNLNLPDKFEYPGLILIETDTPKGNKCVIGAVMPETKKKIFYKYSDSNFHTIINTRAFVSPKTTVGKGSLIDANVTVSAGVTLGYFATVYSGSSIQHDSEVGDFATICPGVTVCGNVKIGEGTFIGAGSVIKNGLTIGKNCVIGCGSVVIRDVQDNETLYGLIK